VSASTFSPKAKTAPPNSTKTSSLRKTKPAPKIKGVRKLIKIWKINKRFVSEIYPYKFVKKAWIENVVAQGEMYYVLNKFFAWYYFKMKKPGAYVRSMATRELNKKLIA
jgi:hypothetical protein